MPEMQPRFVAGGMRPEGYMHSAMEHARSHFEARAIQEAVGIENPPDRWLAQEERDREQNERNAVQAPLLRRVST